MGTSRNALERRNRTNNKKYSSKYRTVAETYNLTAKKLILSKKRNRNKQTNKQKKFKQIRNCKEFAMI